AAASGTDGAVRRRRDWLLRLLSASPARTAGLRAVGPREASPRRARRRRGPVGARPSLAGRFRDREGGRGSGERGKSGLKGRTGFHQMSRVRVAYLNPFSQEVSGPDESLRALLAHLIPLGVDAHLILPAPGA